MRVKEQRNTCGFTGTYRDSYISKCGDVLGLVFRVTRIWGLVRIVACFHVCWGPLFSKLCHPQSTSTTMQRRMSALSDLHRTCRSFSEKRLRRLHGQPLFEKVIYIYIHIQTGEAIAGDGNDLARRCVIVGTCRKQPNKGCPPPPTHTLQQK